MELYMVVCNVTSNVKVFSDYEVFRDFATKERYSHSYYRLNNTEEIAGEDLFYYYE